MSDGLLQAATELARMTGAVAARYFRQDIAVDHKEDGSPVTRADLEAEEAARGWIASHFPGDGIMGEEFGEQRSAGRRRWIIDPIDGTKSFVRGVPLWGSLVAVTDGETVLAGAANFPAVNELIAAAPSQGCWLNGVRCSVSGVSSMQSATVLTTDTRFAGLSERRDRWNALAEQAAVARTWGDAYGYLLVATGRAELMADPVANAWDAAPFLPIIEEAGGMFSDWTGARTVFGGDAIATNQALGASMRAALGVGA